jgi:TrmH family RNA methyltransferase
MLSKSQISLLKSLQQKKYRHEHGLFVVEGHKSVIEFINSPYQVQTVYYTPLFDPKVLNLSRKINFQEISMSDMDKISSLKSPVDVIAVIYTFAEPVLTNELLKQKFSIVLDSVQDPGNMGTIIRTADWFGIDTLVCSLDTVDKYNPKAVQATMGSLPRMRIFYTDLPAFLSDVDLPVFGALLDGDSIFETDFGNEGLIVMGNEGNGISPEVEQYITKRITIPRTGKAESLNVAIATALFCAEIARKG